MLKVGHEGQSPVMGWYVEQDGKRIQNIRALKLECDVNSVPVLTLELVGLDIKMDPTWLNAADVVLEGSCMQCQAKSKRTMSIREMVQRMNGWWNRG